MTYISSHLVLHLYLLNEFPNKHSPKKSSLIKLVSQARWLISRSRFKKHVNILEKVTLIWLYAGVVLTRQYHLQCAAHDM